MSSREIILRGVRRSSAQAVPHPGRYPTPSLDTGWDVFAQRLRSVGGEPLGPVRASEIGDAVREQCASCRGPIVASREAARRLGSGPWRELEADQPPLSLADVELALLWGSIGVAENAAVGVGGEQVSVRALTVLPERILLVLEVEALQADMHAALAQLPEGALQHHHFTWLSGPSKTADIEQTLVLGAHGARSVSVLGVWPEP